MKNNFIGDYFHNNKRILLVFCALLIFSFFSNEVNAQGGDCSGATPLVVNVTCDSGNITDTTEDSPSYTICGGSFQREGWYTFNVTGGPLNVTITAVGNRNLAFQLLSSTSSCGGLSQISCINNQPGSGGTDSTESTTQLLGNGTYYVKVLNVGGANNMNLTSICITGSAAPSGNFTCATATSLPCATTNLTGTTVGSSNTAHGTACSMSNYGAWYTFVGDGQQTTITSTAGAGYDHEMSISSGSCGTYTNLTCQDVGFSGGSETYTFTTSIGVVYYVYISHWDSISSITGTFTISRSCVSIVPPTNDNCSGAVALTVNGTAACTTSTSGNTSFATQSQAGCTGNADDDVWFTFTATNTNHVVSVTPTSLTNAVFQVFSGACGGLTSLACVNNTTGATIETTTLTGLTIGVTYRIRVYSNANGTGQGAFSICVTTPPPPPSNDNCSGATTLTVNPDLNCGTTTAGTVTNATDSGITGSSCFGTDDDDVWYSFVATNTTHHVSLLNVAGSTTDMYHAVYSGASGCGAIGAALICSDDDQSIVSGLTIGQTYYVQVYTYSSTSGQTSTFNICIGSPCNGNGPGTGTTTLGCPSVVSGGLGLNGADPSPFNCTASSTCVDLEATYLDLGDTSTYTVTSIPYAPPYQFSCLANSVSVNDDDVWSPAINLPFDFCFYGNSFNQCTIGSNGILSFDMSNAGTGSGYSFSNNLPSTTGDLFTNTIYGVYHDIDPRAGGEVGWELITLNTGCRALVASWSNVPMYSDNSILYTGMMVLYENTNVIEVYIQEKNIDDNNVAPWNDGNAIVGIQNTTGTAAVVAPGRNGLSTNWTASNEAWRFVPAGTSITSLAWHEGSGTSGPIIGTSDIINVCPTATTTYTAEITYTLCDGSTITETEETTVTVNGNKTWNGSVSSNWNNNNNWSPVGRPTSADCVVIPVTPNNPVVSGASYDALGLNLTIQNGATLTVNSTNDIIINDWVNINAGGILQLNDGASLIQINNNPNTGTMQMNRTVNMRRLDYVYWSSPVTSFASSAISNGTPTGYIYKWTPTIGTNINGFGNWEAANENMVVGKGYIVRGPDAFTTTPASFTATFTGTPNNGVITTPILRGTWNGGNYATGVSSTLGTNYDDNWNLIGNPYPSAVNAISFLTANTNIDGFIKIWTHGTLPSSAIADPFYNNYVYNYTPGDYITYNSSGTSSGPGVFGGNIASGQGFFVSMLHSSATALMNVTFNNSMRNTLNSNSQFFRNSIETDSTNEGKIWLDLIDSNANVVRNLVAYIEGATNNRDRLFDAITDEKLNFNLYSKVGNEPMTIQGRTLPFNQNDLVPMGIKTPQAGNYSIGIGAVEGFFEGTNQDIYLEDLTTNIIHDLRQNHYSFTATGDDSDRFILRFTNNTLGNEDIINDEANVWAITSDNLSVKSTKNSIQSVIVFDVLGRLLADYKDINEHEVTLSKIQRNNVALIIQVTLSNKITIHKRVVY